MNKERRAEIRFVIERLQPCSDDLEKTKDAEDDARDKTHENFHSGNVYIESEECSDTIGDAIDAINEAIGNLKSIV